MTTTLETKIGDRLDLLAWVHLLDPFKWEEITAINPKLRLTDGLYLQPGILINIPELLPEKIPDLLPWNDTTEIQLFEPVNVPPDVQPGSNPDELLSGSGWLTPAAVKILLAIPEYTLPLSIAQGGHGSTTAVGARAALGAVGFADIPASIPPSAIGVTIAPLVNGLVPSGNLPALPPFPTLAELGGVSTSTYNAGLALKLDAAQKGAVNGVAPLGADSLVPSGNLPAPPTLASLGGVSTSTYNAGLALKLDAAARAAANGVAPLGADSLVPSGHLPAPPTLASLGAVSTDTYNAGLALKLNTSARNAANGVAGLDVNSLLALAQFPLGSFFGFTGGASFRAGGIPALTTTLTQAGVTAEGLPIYWLVNASATAGNRLKSIVISNNGNIQFRHHADDGTVGNIVEMTASGNLLTNGTVRPGSGATAFTGASFVAGATYFRTDLLGDSGVGCATYSDGSVWRRVSDGSLTTETARLKKIFTSTTAASQGSNITIPHGVVGSKIVSIVGVIRFAAQSTVPIPGVQPGYQCNVSSDATTIFITNVSSQSANILSMPLSLVMEYTT